MKRLGSIGDLTALRHRLLADRSPEFPTVVIPAGTCGRASGAEELIRAAERRLRNKRLARKVRLRATGCHGFCQMEPSVLVEPEGVFYPKVDPKDVPRLIEAAAGGGVLAELLFPDPATGQRVEKQSDVPFFKKQVRTILGRNEKIDPTRIGDYIETGGYFALADVLAGRDAEWVVEEVKASGLRGRGGAGFPTGRKWEMLAGQRNGHGKFLVCNADEGDPGAYMDRSLLEGNPHGIIEGMLIGAYGTGATEGIIYVRNEYPVAIRHLTVALRQAQELGLLGEDILGTGFSFDIRIAKGAGAFVCGEETALIRSIEGKMGEPRQRPPFPIQKGIDGKPTAINNVETWANIPVIIAGGAKEFAKVGAKGNSGTKIFSLVGKVKNTGLVEVPMGISIRQIVHDIGGGPSGKAKIKAVQTGGPSGGCIPAEKFDLTIDYDSLIQAGSIMGSGGMIVMDENTCMVDMAKYFMNFLKDESCGKCFPCRKGTQRMHEILDDMSAGRGTPEHLGLLEELALAVKDTTMCGLGQTASNPILSTLRYFRDEYERHVVEKKCDAFVCTGLVGAPCQAACPLGTEAWRYVALIEKGEYEEAYRIIRAPNPFPSVCARVCDHKCESRCRLGTSGGEPIAIRTLKRFITDKVDPSVYRPERVTDARRARQKVAVIGAGPAGLSAAHYLSLSGYQVTVLEAEPRPGGMLTACIPAYRLPREPLRREIEALIDENITLQCGVALGRDLTIEELFEGGFKAVFLATGAHGSRQLGLGGEDSKGVFPSMRFLKAFNLEGRELAKGCVGVVGGGNSAVDAARVAVRQEGIESVTLLYRRTRREMPAYEEEIEAALEEGVKLETLASPVKIRRKGGRLAGVQFVRNRLGEVDASGRRRPVPVPGTGFEVPLDTLIVAIGERPESGCLTGLEVNRDGTLRVEAATLRTSREGVFAGGDLVTGPNTVVDAIAAGKKAARVIDRHLRGEQLADVPRVELPEVFVEPPSAEAEGDAVRSAVPQLPAESRQKSFAEVELVLSAEEAIREARRCVRCDLEFTRREGQEADCAAMAGKAT